MITTEEKTVEPFQHVRMRPFDRIASYVTRKPGIAKGLNRFQDNLVVH